MNDTQIHRNAAISKEGQDGKAKKAEDLVGRQAREMVAEAFVQMELRKWPFTVCLQGVP